MKTAIWSILLFLGLVIGCTQQNIELSDGSVMIDGQSKLFQVELYRQFATDVGYYRLYADEAKRHSWKEWKELYDRVKTEHASNPSFPQFRLNVIQHLTTETNFLDVAGEHDVKYVKEMFDHFETPGGIKAKFRMHQFLSAYERADTNRSRVQKIQQDSEKYRIRTEQRLAEFLRETEGRSLTDVEELALQSITSILEEIKQVKEELSQSL